MRDENHLRSVSIQNRTLVVAHHLVQGRLGLVHGAPLSVARTLYLTAPKESHLSPASLALRAFLRKQAAAQGFIP